MDSTKADASEDRITQLDGPKLAKLHPNFPKQTVSSTTISDLKRFASAAIIESKSTAIRRYQLNIFDPSAQDEHNGSKGVWRPKDSIELEVSGTHFAQGGLRNVFKAKDTTTGSNFVVKRYRKEIKDHIIKSLRKEIDEHAKIDVQKTTGVASYYAKKFSVESGLTLEYLPVYTSYDDEPVFIEKFVDIDDKRFEKYINNNGKLMSPTPPENQKICEAFVHYTLHKSNGELMVSDIQGWFPLLCDPEIATRDTDGKSATTAGNWGRDAINEFARAHICSSLCRELQLSALPVKLTEDFNKSELSEVKDKTESAMRSDEKELHRKKWEKIETAVYSGSVEEVRELFAYYAFPYDYTGGDDQYNILHLSAHWGKRAVMQYLVQHQLVSIESRDQNGATPLVIASRKGHTDIVQYLTEAGADISVKDSMGETAIHSACGRGRIDILRYLVEQASADVNVVDNTNNTPLHFASRRNKADAVRYILQECNADLNARNDEGETPLYAAVTAEYNCIETVRVYHEYSLTKGVESLLHFFEQVFSGLHNSGFKGDEDKREQLNIWLNGVSNMLLQTANDPTRSFIFFGGEIYRTLLGIFLMTMNADNITLLNVNLLIAVYIALQTKVQCFESKRKWLKSVLEPYSNMYNEFSATIEKLALTRVTFGGHGEHIQMIAQKIWIEYIKPESGFVENFKRYTKKSCKKFSSCKDSACCAVKSTDSLSSEESIENPTSDEEEPSRVRTSRFHGCKAAGAIAHIHWNLGVILYLLDLSIKLVVGYDDYTGFSERLGLFEMLLVFFTLVHENVRSWRCRYETEEERLRLRLGKYDLTLEDWFVHSELNFSNNKFIKHVYMAFWPFKTGGFGQNYKSVVYNILSILMLRPIVDRFLIVFHEPGSLRILYRRKAEHHYLQQFYMILAQLPLLLVQFYTVQIIVNNVSNPHLHQDVYSNCADNDMFHYVKMNQSVFDNNNIVCKAFNKILACSIFFRIISMLITLIDIPPKLVFLEDGIRKLAPAAASLSDEPRFFLSYSYILMVPARVFMFATMMHAVGNKSHVILYVVVRGLVELAINIYSNIDLKKSSEKYRAQAERSRLIEHKLQTAHGLGPLERATELGLLEILISAYNNIDLKRQHRLSATDRKILLLVEPETLKDRVEQSKSTFLAGSFWKTWSLLLFSIRDIFVLSIRDLSGYLSTVPNISYDSLRKRQMIFLRVTVFICEGFVGALVIEKGYPCGEQSHLFKYTGWVCLTLLIFSVTILMMITDLLHPHKVKKAPKTFLKKSVVVFVIGLFILSLECVAFFLSSSRTITEVWIFVFDIVVLYILYFSVLITVIKLFGDGKEKKLSERKEPRTESDPSNPAPKKDSTYSIEPDPATQAENETSPDRAETGSLVDTLRSCCEPLCMSRYRGITSQCEQPRETSRYQTFLERINCFSSSEQSVRVEIELTEQNKDEDDAPIDVQEARPPEDIQLV